MTFITPRNQSIFFIFTAFFFSSPPREIKIIYVPINHLSLPNFRCIRFEACTRPAYPISTYTIASNPPSPVLPLHLGVVAHTYTGPA